MVIAAAFWLAGWGPALQPDIVWRAEPIITYIDPDIVYWYAEPVLTVVI